MAIDADPIRRARFAAVAVIENLMAMNTVWPAGCRRTLFGKVDVINDPGNTNVRGDALKLARRAVAGWTLLSAKLATIMFATICLGEVSTAFLTARSVDDPRFAMNGLTYDALTVIQSTPL